MICRNASAVLAFHLWPTIFGILCVSIQPLAAIRNKNHFLHKKPFSHICRSAVPAPNYLPERRSISAFPRHYTAGCGGWMDRAGLVEGGEHKSVVDGHCRPVVVDDTAVKLVTAGGGGGAVLAVTQQLTKCRQLTQYDTIRSIYEMLL